MDQQCLMNGVTLFTKATTNSTAPASEFATDDAELANNGGGITLSFIIGKMLSFCHFFKDYLNHFGLLRTATVMVLA